MNMNKNLTGIRRTAALLLSLLTICSLLSSCGLLSLIPPLPTEPEVTLYVPDTSGQTGSFSLSEVPPYSGSPYAAVHDNVPYFRQSELTAYSYETYGELDSLGRCTACMASVGRDLMPTEARGSIGMVKPTGWVTSKYDFVDGKYLYNRCHLIGFQLTGENANVQNLITGTRSMNTTGMLPFENMVADYVKETGNHVLYRVTPVFVGNELVARGVLMEAVSVEDGGEGVLFCVFCYNVEPGVVINYADGSNEEGDPVKNQPGLDPMGEKTSDYVINVSSGKFHLPSCSNAESMSPANRKDFHGTRRELTDKGYVPCGVCKP